MARFRLFSFVVVTLCCNLSSIIINIIITTTTITTINAMSVPASFQNTVSTTSDSSSNSNPIITITGLYRHAVKGFSADELDTVTVQAYESFPDDRRFALLKQNKEPFDPDNPEWIHKSNFLCAFSAPSLMAKYRAHYSIQREIVVIEKTTSTTTKNDETNNNDSLQPNFSFGLPNDITTTTIHVQKSNDSGDENDTATTTTTTTTKRLLSLFERKTEQQLLDSVDLATSQGRQTLAEFFTKLSNDFDNHNNNDTNNGSSSASTTTALTCVTAENFQFGNTSSGVKKKGNSRTVHIINAATVREVSKAIGIPLNPTRFRPNIIIDGDDGLKPWEEFEWVGKSIQCGPTCRMDVIQRTVRCDAVSVDPLVFPNDVLDIPALLVKHFPEHGPYLGVYAHIEEGGTIQIGDVVSVL